MYLYLPIINKGVEYLTEYELRLVVMSTIGILVFWRDYKNPKEDIFFLNNGGSVLWFFIFYLTGSFIGKYRINYTEVHCSILKHIVIYKITLHCKMIPHYYYCCIVIIWLLFYIFYKFFN